MTRLGLLFPAALLVSGSAFAQECSPMWKHTLDTDPTHPKGMSGDTNAGYAVYSFLGDPGKRYEVKGEFPSARFISLETSEAKREYKVDNILDFNIEPDSGSVNPFREGAALDAPNRSFTVHVVPEGAPAMSGNLIRLPSHRKLQALIYRIYSPKTGTVLPAESLPKIFAYDVETGKPASCPEHKEIDMYFHMPQFFTVIVPRKTEFDFKKADIAWGPNAAIPYYMYGANPLRKGSEVIVVRFKAPSFLDTQTGTGTFSTSPQTRYWSLCAQNIVKNETLSCLPDFLAKPDAKGFVTAVFGQGADVKNAAAMRGVHFLNDNRVSNQRVIVFAYRNILPNKSFQDGDMYKGDYLPHAVVCSRADFVTNRCE